MRVEPSPPPVKISVTGGTVEFHQLDVRNRNRPPFHFYTPQPPQPPQTHITTMASTYPALELQAVVGFGGKVPNGLLCHPDGVHLIYPLGSTIVVKNTVLGTQTFLQGHSNMVSCMELSRDGCKLASGQVSTSYCSCHQPQPPKNPSFEQKEKTKNRLAVAPLPNHPFAPHPPTNPSLFHVIPLHHARLSFFHR